MTGLEFGVLCFAGICIAVEGLYQVWKRSQRNRPSNYISQRTMEKYRDNSNEDDFLC